MISVFYFICNHVTRIICNTLQKQESLGTQPCDVQRHSPCDGLRMKLNKADCFCTPDSHLQFYTLTFWPKYKRRDLLPTVWRRLAEFRLLPHDAGLGSRNSVRLSVCRMYALWQNQTVHCGYFYTSARKGNHSSFLTPTVVGRRCPLPSEICTQSDPPPSKNANYDKFPLITSEA